MISDNEILSLAKTFHVEVKKVERIKTGVYRLHSTSDQSYCLKRMRYSPARLQWMDRTLLELRRQGFQAIAWRDPQTPMGQTLSIRSKMETSPYILTPWLQGRQPSPQSKQDLMECAKALALFHQTGQRIKLNSDGALNRLGTWPQQFTAWAELIKRYVNLAEQHPKNGRLNQLLSAHREFLLRRTEQSLQTLNNSNYHKLCKEAAAQGSLCHGDSGPTNFVITEQGAAIIDFETLRIDLRIYDIFRLIRLTCGGSNGWDFTFARHTLDGYQTVSRLAPVEYELLDVWLQFPYKVSKTLSLHDPAATKTNQVLEDEIEKALLSEQRLPPFLQELRHYAGKE